MTLAPEAFACAAIVRDRLNIRHTPRTTDLYEMVQQLGATISYRRGGALQGAVEQADDCLPKSWQVSIDKTLPSYRFRFVLSHELGHLYLRHNELSAKSEERWCNEFAAELLMPHSCIHDEYKNAALDFASIRDVARRYDVSRSAALVRLRRVLNWQRGIITLRQRGNMWSVARMTAIPSVALYQLEPTTTARDIPPHLANFEAWLKFGFRRELIEILSECERRGSWVDALINTTDLEQTCTQIARENPRSREPARPDGGFLPWHS